jgi:hypothetical protein
VQLDVLPAQLDWSIRDTPEWFLQKHIYSTDIQHRETSTYINTGYMKKIQLENMEKVYLDNILRELNNTNSRPEPSKTMTPW